MSVPDAPGGGTAARREAIELTGIATRGQRIGTEGAAGQSGRQNGW
jgi:hypothetical protein